LRLFNHEISLRRDSKENHLKDKIIELAIDAGLDRTYVKAIIRHVVSEFSKNGLGSDYYGYHGLNHELEVTYFTLLALKYYLKRNEFSQKDVNALFLAALLQDYDPLKRFDKPEKEDVESFIRNDKKLAKLVEPFEIDLDIVIALIYRTINPFKENIADNSLKKINGLFTQAGITDNDSGTRTHYYELGWFLSICNRIAGYSLGNFEYSNELARLNAHAMGWHPSIINEKFVNYFTALKEEKSMLEPILQAIPENVRKNFHDNVAGFRQAWDNEVQIRAMLRQKKMNLVIQIERTDDVIDANLINSIMKMYKEIHAPISPNEVDFKKSLCAKETILITLRINEQDGTIVGFVKGGPLKEYKLRRGTNDENNGKNNTAYMDWIRIKPEYLGENNTGNLLRSGFINEARNRGYEFVSSYVHRDVIESRIDKGEAIEVVQKYDPDKLDYYRQDLSKI
jgi:hypothetical protein